MNSVTYQNMLLIMTLVNVAAGVASVTLAVHALRVLRGQSKKYRTPGKELLLRKDSDRILGHETPTEVSTKQVVRRSPLLTVEGRRAYINGD